MQRVVITAFLTFLFTLHVWDRAAGPILAAAVPVFFVLYLMLFSVGDTDVGRRLTAWIGRSPLRTVFPPIVLALLFYLYAASGGENPFRGGAWIIPLLYVLPTLFFMRQPGGGGGVSLRDGIGALLCVVPFALNRYPVNSKLPFTGGGFETVYVTLALIAVVYALVIVRRLPGVGFSFRISPPNLRRVVVAWALFFPVAALIGFAAGLLQPVGRDQVVETTALITATGVLLRVFFHTALPEEFYFRGLFQNMLAQRLEQTGNWRRYLHFGIPILLAIAVVFAVSLRGAGAWMPAAATLAVLLPAYRMSLSNPAGAHNYTAMALMSVLFGLGHYHTHSPVFIGLAVFAGWTYGYVYLRTQSVFYSALCHTMVNTSPALFGLEIVLN